MMQAVPLFVNARLLCKHHMIWVRGHFDLNSADFQIQNHGYNIFFLFIPLIIF